MEISKTSFEQLKVGGVSVTDLLKTMQAAVSHRAIVKEEYRQTKKTFNDTQRGETRRDALTPTEDHALTIKAYDDANLKLRKTWGEGHEWILPPDMLGKALAIWPIKKPAMVNA